MTRKNTQIISKQGVESALRAVLCSSFMYARHESGNLGEPHGADPLAGWCVAGGEKSPATQLELILGCI